ncbi:hypothetical protein QTP86_031391, partial [Hemibagrus guttatus]
CVHEHGDIGHKRFSCPHKEHGSERQDTETNTEANTETNTEQVRSLAAVVLVSSVSQSDDADGSNVKTVGQSLSYSDIAKGAGHSKRYSGAARTGNQDTSDSDVAKIVSPMEKRSVALKR